MMPILLIGGQAAGTRSGRPQSGFCGDRDL
jgi:hypothetical protein